ncbi:threonine aldolase family protein [Lichenicola sp.]|uniref:threonine aldolase family protein n=1 Tax=Lichenicola sp. TaxID=2804529 RepID=UPI003B003B9C
MKPIRKNFGSDNVGPVSPAIMAAMVEANTGAVPSYGGDQWTAQLAALTRDVFETEVEVFSVATGTAANALALSALVPPYGAVYCDSSAHVDTDECGAPEFFTGGAKLLGLPSYDGRLSPAALRAHLEASRAIGVHKSKPTAITITQATEWGTVYALDEVQAIGETAQSLGLSLHMDGARFANAMATLGCSPAEITWKAGVDVLSLGATKNGAMAAEAVVFFRRDLAVEFARRRKRAGHLWSKARFLSAQLIAYLSDDLWLRNARQANAMALRLAQGLVRIRGARLLHEVQSNEVFVVLPEPVIGRLEAAGFLFYRWYLPAGQTLEAGTASVRLVTGLDTEAADVDALLDAAVLEPAVV